MSLRLVETGNHVVAIEDERVVGTIGVLGRPDGVGLVFPPELDGGPVDLAEQLVSAALGRLRRAGVAFAQLTLPVAESAQAGPFVRSGFVPLTEALMLGRTLDSTTSEEFCSELTPVACDPFADEHLLTELIARISQGSLDCPELDQFRTPSMLLAAHREASLDGRARWCRYEAHGVTVGATLATVVDDEDAWELLFFGVCPEARGRGYGAAMLDLMMSEARRHTTRIRTAVDVRNRYAIECYVDAGYSEEGRVQVWIHSLTATA